jgi:uncharacterized protein (DUF1501 family)
MNRREFLTRTLQGSSLLAVGSMVPEFLARAADGAKDAKESKDNVLVVVEMTGGNDGLNTVVPYGDDAYHKARPTLRINKSQAHKIDDYVGLHPNLGRLNDLYMQKQVAVVQGVGYPNPDRSHFESMDIWQTADPKRMTQTGWLARSTPLIADTKGSIPGIHFGDDRLPMAMTGSAGGVVSINDAKSFKLNLSGDEARVKARKKLLDDVTNKAEPTDTGAGTFVRRRQVQTYASLESIEEVLHKEKTENTQQFQFGSNQTLPRKMTLIARLINKGLGTRIYYVSIDGFDTHARQAEMHETLMGEVSNAIGGFFATLGENASRAVVMTFSEFGRRVQENGSRGTDHGSGSCLFVAGPRVKGGLYGKYPSLTDLDAGDLRFNTDFRKVYATLLDDWLKCDSKAVLGGEKWEHLPLIAAADEKPSDVKPAPDKKG